MPVSDRVSRRGPVAAKRQAILGAALTTFAARGFARTSVETIAEAAGVSNRTVYNHFRDKAQLFQVVIETSAALVADAQLAILQRHLDLVPADLAELEERLVDFATDWTTPLPGYETHRALVEQVRAEVGHVPDSAIEAWQESGPRRVRRGLAEAFGRFADAGLLRAGDPALAAEHFRSLINLADPLQPHAMPDPASATERIAGAVHAFLHGHAGN